MTKGDIQQAIKEVLSETHLSDAEFIRIRRSDFRIVVSRQVDRTLEALRERREAFAELYGASDYRNALDFAAHIEEAIGDALAALGEDSYESQRMALEALTKAWAHVRSLKSTLEPEEGTFVAGLHDNSVDITDGLGVHESEVQS